MMFKRCLAPVLTAALAAVSSPAWASGSGMPWEAPLTKVVSSITGPVAQAIAVLAIVIFGCGFAIAENGSTLRRGMGVLGGLSIVFAATTLVTSFFGFAGGAMVR